MRRRYVTPGMMPDRLADKLWGKGRGNIGEYSAGMGDGILANDVQRHLVIRRNVGQRAEGIVWRMIGRPIIWGLRTTFDRRRE